MNRRASAHLDGFAEERMPPPEQMPEHYCGVPIDLPARINAAGYLLDRRVAAGEGDRPCILAPGIAWSYAQLQANANRIARVLTEDFAIEPGNRVLLYAPNTPMLAACWLAVLKAGGIAVTTMPLYRAGELRFMLEKAQVKHALCDVRLADEFERACREYRGVTVGYVEAGAPAGRLADAAAGKSETFENVATAATDVALVAFTSGTTGTPKAAMHYHRDIVATCETYAAHVLRPRAGDRFCGSPPLAFTFGLGGLLLFPLYAGAATLLLEKAGPAELLEAIERYRITTLFTAPIAYRAMLAAAEERDLSSLRTCVSAGEALPKVVWDAWYAKTGCKVLDGIGSTEMLHIFIGSPEEAIRPGSTGRAVPGYAAEIHDEDGRPVPDGTIGRLAVKGPTGCKYLQDERQEIYVRHGWNYPGDAYSRDADGYFWYVARTDDMIVSAGYNISGPEVEQALIGHADVKEVAVVGKRDARKETNFVKAFVVLVDGCAHGEEKAEELRAYCKEQIAPFKAPREIEFVTELPRTHTGKLQRYKLRDPS